MNLKTTHIGTVIGAVFFSSILWSGCGTPKENPNDKTNPKEIAEKKKKRDRANMFQVGDELFSIPSPVQTAILIKETGAPYNKDILNDPKKVSTYSSQFEMAINLGIYGADLGYITMYEQTQDGISYMTSTKKMANELGISSAFSKELMSRFEANIDNKDSLVSMVTEAYRASDAFLKNNEREDVGVLVLAGGWLESLFFSIKIAEQNGSQKINDRIGEQKSSLENLIKLLQKYSNEEEYAEFVEEMVDLYFLFDEVKIDYQFVKPTTHKGTKLTIINSTSKVNLAEEQLSAIAEKVQSIRNHIVG